MAEGHSRLIGYGAALLATMIWAGNFVAARALAWAIPPLQFNFWRWVIAFAVILPFAIPHLRADWPIFRAHFGYMSLMALLGVTLMNAFIYQAGHSTESLNMALLMPASPLVVLVLARVFYAEPIRPGRLAGMLCAMCGILVLISRGSWQTLLALEVRPGDLWTMGCMLSFALYSLLMRKRPKDISPSGFNALVFGLGLVYALPMIALEMYFLPLPRFSLPLLTGLLYAGVGCSALAFWLWTVGIDRVGPVRASIIYYSLPLFAAIMARIVLDETVSFAQILGGALITAGIFAATFQGHKAKNS